MCGIFGYSGKNPVDPIRFRWLACENQSRGEDSSGIATPAGLYKDAVPAKEIVLKGAFQELVEGSTTIIGHTRRATMGAKIAKNAHPFEIFENAKTTDAHLVGTHNGQVFEYFLDKICK
jgi:glucosamine 6-phosphate synthetase-like amidotransferase/phosphosugar isomerase protein